MESVRVLIKHIFSIPPKHGEQKELKNTQKPQWTRWTHSHTDIVFLCSPSVQRSSQMTCLQKSARGQSIKGSGLIANIDAGPLSLSAAVVRKTFSFWSTSYWTESFFLSCVCRCSTGSCTTRGFFSPATRRSEGTTSTPSSCRPSTTTSQWTAWWDVVFVSVTHAHTHALAMQSQAIIITVIHGNKRRPPTVVQPPHTHTHKHAALLFHSFYLKPFSPSECVCVAIFCPVTFSYF